MHRFLRLSLVSLVAWVTGCGSSGGPVFDGFVPTGGSALIFAPTTCSVPFVGSAAVAGIALDFTSYPESCDVITATQLCGNKANATRVIGIVFAGAVGAAAADPLGPGTYPYLPEPPTGAFQATAATAVQDDDSCQPLAGTSTLQMDGGAITLTSVTETLVSGSTNIHFNSGKTFEYTFELPICAASFDLCARFSPCGSHACVP